MPHEDDTAKLRASARETLDVAFVRRRTGMVYVKDAHALAVFEGGEAIFDVDPHGRNLPGRLVISPETIDGARLPSSRWWIGSGGEGPAHGGRVRGREFRWGVQREVEVGIARAISV